MQFFCLLFDLMILIIETTGGLFFENTRKTLKSNLVLIVFLVFESKDL